MHNSSRFLPLIIFLLWWGIWLIIHNTSLSPIYVASLKAQSYFMIMIFMVIIGYCYAFLNAKSNSERKNKRNNFYQIVLTRDGKYICIIILIVLFVSILIVGNNTGAFITNSKDYFYQIRGVDGLGNKLGNNKYIDILMVLLFYPLMFSLWIAFLVMPKSKFIKRGIVFITLIHFLFSYIYQVNYPIAAQIITLLIYLFIFERNQYGKIPMRIRKMILRFLILFGGLMIYAATNRLGGFNLSAILQKYLISYHTLGFYFFDAKLHDIQSVLNSDPTYGRSFLGWFDSIFDLVVRFFKEDIYIAANLENRNDNMHPILVGEFLGRPYVANAFGTILFTMYRDFRVFGIVFYSFLYGLFLAYSYSRKSSVKWKAIFIILIFAGIKSIGVSSVERPFFWFSIIFIFIMFSLFIKRKETRG